MHTQSDTLHRTDRDGIRLHLATDEGWTDEQIETFIATLPAGPDYRSYDEWTDLIAAHEKSLAPTFATLLAQMSGLTSMPLDAREQFEAMLRANFTGMINDDEFDAEVNA